MDYNTPGEKLPYKMIDSDRKLIELRKYLHLHNIKRIAMDFECEFNLHSYGTKLCLIQVFDGTRYFIIDPFHISTKELARTLETKSLVKLFYAANSDRSLVYRQYGINIKSIYDQLILVDTLGFPEKGLDTVLFKVLGIEVKHKKKYQRHNWTRRPIGEDALQYALSDVRYLFELNTKLLDEIKKTGKYEDLVIRLVQNDFDFTKRAVPAIFRSRDYKDLSRMQKERFEKLADLREKIAQKLNLPPHSVIPNPKLKLIAQDHNYINTSSFSRGVRSEILELVKRKIREAGL